MALYVISDLHLSTQNASKSMDVFGSRWNGYTEKIKKNWERLITPEDTVIIPGDISWALTLHEAIPDLTFLNALPGTKILSKGNHDFWWSTVSKLEKTFAEHDLDTLRILNNNAIHAENVIVAGSRGWFSDPTQQVTAQKPDFDKIIRREAIHLRMSLEAARALQDDGQEIIAFFHFPPIWSDTRAEETLSLLREFSVRRAYFGHIHGAYSFGGSITDGDLSFSMVSADYLDFIPKRIFTE